MAINSASGTFTVGPNTTNTSSNPGPMSITVAFPASFETAPIVVATTLQDPAYNPPHIPDTFAVTITAVTPALFTAQVYRVDNGGQGWAQNLMLNWIALST